MSGGNSNHQFENGNSGTTVYSWVYIFQGKLQFRNKNDFSLKGPL